MIKPLIFISLIFSSFHAYTQHVIQGTVKSAEDQTGLPGATVILEKKADASQHGTVTNVEGEFSITVKDSGQYTLKAQFVGYEVLSKTLQISEQTVNVGDFLLFEETTTLQTVEVTAKTLSGEQKGDTTQFNAEAFKTAPDASAQDLVEKMPGILMQNGKLQAQGEDVQQIFIDGRPFFGNDVQAALQNLPAEVIAEIQVYDQKSDKALVSGIDDGDRIRTINIVTKPNRRKGQFGKSSVGYGTDNRYLAGSSVNFFNEGRRITVTGLSNNVNTLNYTADPNNQGDTRNEDGIITTHSLGLNFIDRWGDKIDISGSYFYTQRKNEGIQTTIRDFVLSSDSGQVYTENRVSTRTNADHRFNLRMDYQINERNRLLIRPSFSLEGNKVEDYFLGETITNSGPLNQTENTATSDNQDYDFNNRMYYSHKFKKDKRSLNLSLHTAYHTNRDDAYRLAENVFYNAIDRNELLNQYTHLKRTGLDWESEVSYTEPIGKNSIIEVEYEIGNTLNDSDKRTFNYEERTDAYSLLDTAISNTFESKYLTQETELGYQYQVKNLRVQLEAQYQHARLLNDQVFPRSYALDRVFRSVLPSARLEYKISDSRNLEFIYRTWTNEPSVGQLQDVIDNSNPLQLRTGNLNLDQAYTHWIRTRYKMYNPESSRSFYASLQANFIQSYISSSTFIAVQPAELAEGIVLEEGSQLTRPVNMNGYYEIRSHFNYGQPLDLISSNLNFNGSVRYTRRPGLINDQINLSHASRFSLGTSVSSNISEQVDFNLSTRSTYNVVENSLRPALNNNFFNQTTRLRYDWIIWEGLVYRTDLNHQLNAGLSADFDNSFLLWNMSIGKKVFKSQLGELSLNVYDLLKQNNNVSRNITEAFVEDTQSNVLQRYFMLTFTYNLRHFSEGTDVDDYKELYRD